jgi:MFS family permease
MERREWLFAGVISACHAVQHVYLRLLPPLIPLLAVDLGFPLWKLGLLVGARSAADGLGQTPMGVLSDSHDRRLLLSGGVAVMGAGFALFALAPMLGGSIPGFEIAGYAVTGTFAVMFVAVLVAGVGSSAVHPTGYPLITANISGEYKGRALGIWGSSARLGDATIPLLVGVLILVTIWESIVLVTGLLGIVYAGVLFVVLGRDEFDTAPMDDPDGSGDGAGDDGSIWSVDRRLYIYPVLAVFAFFGFRSIVTGGVTTFVPAFITEAYAYTLTLGERVIEPEAIANFYYTVLLLTAGITQLAAGELVDRYDHRAVLLGFLSLAAIALTILSFAETSPTMLFLVLLFLGAGLWGVNPARDALISEITPDEREGRTFGYLWTGTLLLGAIAPIVVGYIGDVASLRDGFQLLAAITAVSVVPIVVLYSDRVYVNIEDYRAEEQ